MNRLLCCLGLFLLGFGTAHTCAAEDFVVLDDGSEIRGTIQEESSSALTIKETDSGQIRSVRKDHCVMIERAKKAAIQDVQQVVRVQVSAPSETKTGDTENTGQKEGGEGEKAGKKDGEGGDEGEAKEGDEKGGEGGKTADKKGEKGKGEANVDANGWPILDEKLKASYDEAFAKIDSDNPAERSEGRSALSALGKDIIPELIKGLNHIRAETRGICAELLGEFSARNAAKAMVESFYANMPDKGACAWYVRPYINSLKSALPKVTGQSYIGVESRSPLVQDALKQYVDWYNGNYDRLPPQVGEEVVDPTDPEYMDKIQKARALQLARKSWPRPAQSSELDSETADSGSDSGGEQKGYPKEASRNADKKWAEKEYGEKVDRESAGGLFREKDQQYGKDFFNR
ncbi:MAG: hypothetical protein L6R28_23555 [Planctomycetes bacterium]|nr:hypothetical protein [Planctomycetota bacterium]